MANVLFKQGTQASLDTIRTNKTAIEGSFYLTNDTHRLYIGRANGDAVPVNEGVNTVATLDDLPNVTSQNAPSYVGQFYYVTGSNILCVYSASVQAGAVRGGWVQINPNTDTHLSDFNIDITVTNGVATVSTAITETSGDPSSNVAGDTTTKNFQVAGAGGITISTTNGANAGTGDILTITGDQYSVAAGNDNAALKTVDLQLSSTTGHNSSVTFKGSDTVNVTKDGTAIKIDAVNTQLASATGANESQGFSITVADTAGNSEKATIDPIIVVGGETANQQTFHFVNGTATLAVYTKEEIDSKMSSLDSMTYRGTIGATRTLGQVQNAGVQIGDTYLLDGQVNGINTDGNSNATAHIGDMIIARGTEDTNGNITTSTLVWDIIPSGDDLHTDTHYTFKATNGTGANGDGVYAGKAYRGIELRDTSDDNNLAGTLNIYAGDNLAIDGTPITDGTTITGNKIIISHANVATSGGTAAPATQEMNGSNEPTFAQSPGGSLSFTAVTSVTRDTKGHVIGVKTKDITVSDTQAIIDKNDYQSTAATASGITTATVTNTIHSSKTNGDQVSNQSGTFALASSTIQLTTANTGTDNNPKSTVITADIVWGTF